MTIEQIAKVCHDTNKSYCETIGDNSQKSWEEAEAWQKDSAIKGVQYRIENPNAPASAQHDAWMYDKVKSGWQRGEVKDAEKKTHPCIVSYEQLPKEQKLKDKLFINIVDALK